jgi:hypothetical protein
MAIDWLFKKYPRGKKTCDYCNTTRWGLARPNFPFCSPVCKQAYQEAVYRPPDELVTLLPYPPLPRVPATQKR